jgi:hypothetical protein
MQASTQTLQEMTVLLNQSEARTRELGELIFNAHSSLDGITDAINDEAQQIRMEIRQLESRWWDLYSRMYAMEPISV